MKKKAKKKPRDTEIVFVLDRSGSMERIKDDAIGGYNAFVTDQAAAPGKAAMSLIQFDHEHDTVYIGQPVKKVEPLTPQTFTPRGCTALRDAIARGVALLRERLASAKPKALAVLGILTDGHENASEEVSHADIQALLNQCRTDGWAVTFLAADQAGMDAGVALGVQASNAAVFAGGKGAQAALAAASSNVRSYRTTGDEKDLSYSPAQRRGMTERR